MLGRYRYLAGIVLLLSGCGDVNEAPETPSDLMEGNLVSRTVSGTAETAWGVVQQPFEDVGIKEKPIPELLQKIANNPYAMPNPLTCDGLTNEITSLDKVLGPDVCTIKNPTGKPAKGYFSQGADMGANAVKDKAVGLVRTQTNILPFSGLIRQISGAESHSREFVRATEAGKLRRAFLRGLLSAQGQCSPQRG